MGLCKFLLFWNVLEVLGFAVLFHVYIVWYYGYRLKWHYIFCVCKTKNGYQIRAAANRNKQLVIMEHRAMRKFFFFV